MRVREEFTAAIKEAQRQRAEIEKINKKFDRLATGVHDYYTAGMSTEKAYREQLAALNEEKTEQIEACQRKIQALGREAVRIGKLETEPNPKMIEEDTLKLLDSGIRLTADEWQATADKYRHNATMTRILRDRYDRDPVMVSENPTGLVDGEVSYPAKIHWGQSPAERAEIFNRFTDQLAHGAESGYYDAQKNANQDSYWNEYAIHYMSQIEGEDMTGIEKDFPIERPAERPRPVIW